MPGTKEVDEIEFIQQLVHHRIVSEGQLKAAYDYQRSLGGDISDILVKLGMMRRSKMDALLEAAANGVNLGNVEAQSQGITILEPHQVDQSKLKIHHKILDKLPREIVEKYLIALFFPASDLDSRKLILGHGRELPDKVRKACRSTLGVELYVFPLSPGRAALFLTEYFQRKYKKVPEEIGELAEGGRDEPVPEYRPDPDGGEEPAAPVAESAPALVKPSASASSETTAKSAPERETAASDDPFVRGLDELQAAQKSEAKPVPPAEDSEATGAGLTVEASDSEKDLSGTVTALTASDQLRILLAEVESAELRGLIALLVKKGLVRKDELGVEIELQRHRR